MRPETPRRGRSRPWAVADIHPRFVRSKPYLQPVHRCRSAPDNPDDAIHRPPDNVPLLDTDRCGCDVDHCRCKVAREPHAGDLMGPCGKFKHLRRGLDIVSDKVDAVDPFDARAAVPARHDKPKRSAVVPRERRAVHARGEKRLCALEVVAREDPARTRRRCQRWSVFVIQARDAHVRRARQRPGAIEQGGYPNAVPSRGAHQSIIVGIRVAGAFKQMGAQRRRELRKRVSANTPGPADATSECDRPGMYRVDFLWALRPYEEAIVRHDHVAPREVGEIGEQACIQSGAKESIQRRVVHAQRIAERQQPNEPSARKRRLRGREICERRQTRGREAAARRHKKPPTRQR